MLELRKYRILLPLILPIGTRWIARQEKRILARGIALNAEQIGDAIAAGVAAPERVRLLRVNFVPLPRQSALRVVALKLGLLSPHTAGLTARYGIFVRHDFWHDRALLIHELAHTAQYERFGGIRPFLRQYLQECLTDGYPFGQLEIEAARVAYAIANQSGDR
jgi:hypothetical protein